MTENGALKALTDRRQYLNNWRNNEAVKIVKAEESLADLREKVAGYDQAIAEIDAAVAALSGDTEHIKLISVDVPKANVEAALANAAIQR